MTSPGRVGTIVAHELRLAVRDPISIMVLVGFPIVTMAFLQRAFRPVLVQRGYEGATGAEHVVPGQATMGAFFIVAMVTFAFFAEHGWGTWDRLRASAAGPLEIVLGKSIPRVALVLAQFALIFGVGFLAMHLHVRGSAIALVPLAVVYSVCLVLLGVAVTAVCRTAQQANAIAFAGMVMFGAIGGAFVPLEVLPGWARAIGPATPTYWTMRGFRSVILDGRGFAAIVTPVGVLIAMTLGFVLVAVARLRFDDRKIGWS